MKDAIKPNLNGPRHRSPRYNSVSNEVIDKIAESEDSLVKDVKQIKKIILETNKAIAQTIIDYRDGIELPDQLGYIFLGTCQPKIRKNVDFKTTKHYLKVIQHRNWESDNYLAKIFYTNYETKYRFKHHDVWAFSGAREFTRNVAASYPENWKKYIQVDHTLKVSRLFRKYMCKVRRAKEDAEVLKTYNPLDFD
jgi:hypothetical protein